MVSPKKEEDISHEQKDNKDVEAAFDVEEPTTQNLKKPVNKALAVVSENLGKK